jgi:hypothetical protein
MKKIIRNPVVILLVLVFLAACSDEKEPVQLNVDGVEDIAGMWLLNEYGYSPGDRYITEHVSVIPAQTIHFFADGRMTSNLAGLSEYKFFEINFDEQIQLPYLIVYKTAEEAAAKVEPFHSYTIQTQNGELRLSYRYCIEGCHMKFGKIGGSESDE